MNARPTSQPVLWRRPWWATPEVAALLWAGLVAYGSLMPFDFDPSRFGAGIFALSAERSPVEDVALNLALYVPLGVLLRLAWERWWLAALGVAALSYAMECAQGLSPTRVGAWQDVVSNAAPGVVAAIVTPWCVAWFRRAAFACYTRGVLFDRTIRWARSRPWLMLVVVAANLVLFALWWSAHVSPVRPSDSLATNWMPFGDHFARSYDTAALFLGRSLVVYCVLGMLLSIAMMRKTQRRPLMWVALVTAALVGVVEVVRRTAGRDHADVTEPIVAVIAVLLVFTSAWLFIHAVRCSCRRRKAVPVEHDRRRRRHDYEFALTR